MEYILNETPLKTTNNFKINNIKIDLDLPLDYNFKEFETKNTNKIKVNYSLKEDFTSKIGLHFKKAYLVEIIVPKNSYIDDIVEFTYNFTNDDVLIDEVKIVLEENCKVNFLFKYVSCDNNYHFHHLKEVIESNNNSSANITFINLLNNNSKSFIAIEGNAFDNSNITHNIIDYSGKTRIYNVSSNTYLNANNIINCIYTGNKDNLIDINFYLANIGKCSNNNIEVQGVLNDNAIKHFKGTIDFIEGSSESIGKENENCLLLSDNSLSRSLPMLLCHEENVSGSHSVSTGKIDEEVLFYLKSRGFSDTDATKLIIESNFNRIINNLPNQIKEEVSEILLNNT